MEQLIISKSFAYTGTSRVSTAIDLPKGYGALNEKLNGASWGTNTIVMIASSASIVQYGKPNVFCHYIAYGKGAFEFHFSGYGNGLFITNKVGITIWLDDSFIVNFEIVRTLTPEAYAEWQRGAFQSILEAYEDLKNEAEAKMSEFNPNLPGLNPEEKSQLFRNELKNEAIRRMLRCNSLGIVDDYVIGQEYDSDCCKDNANAAKVKFLETVFDWKNMTYEFYPYFYGSRDVIDGKGVKLSDNWNEIQKFTDSDPHFEAFLQASYACINLPVHRDSSKEIAAVNFVLNNSIANYEVVPEGMQSLIEELDLEAASLFTYDLEGNELPVPKETVDLGIFKIPTDLVILECGTADGVKPRPFPESTDEPESDVEIPKQFSPAIIADTCSE